MAKAKRVRTSQEGALRSESGQVIEGLKRDTLEKQDLQGVLADCFNRYARMVLTDRAIPDVRDGLKPVQRRIIYDMWLQGITHDRKTVKCAKVVGDVIGKFHPHGDASVYEAMVHLSQDWKMEVPLLTFQGNNGSIDSDPAAAYRYTEAKLSLASDYLTQDLDENTVDMMLTFDDVDTEPVVLPAAFPNLLVNGAQGIAVGNATNIPTHNPDEVIDACLMRLRDPECTLEDICQVVQGPDFPTGGIIDDREAIRKLYATGRASFYIHSKAEVDQENSRIVITEIPYGTVKSQMVAELDEKRVRYHIDNITEVRDESAEDIRVVLDIRRGSDPQQVLDYLVNKGLLRSTFSANMLVLDRGHPRTLGLLPIIDSYLQHREDVVTRRSRYERKKAAARLEIVQGLLKASSIIDQVIATIRQSDSRAAAKRALMDRFGFTANQADAIGNMRLYSLTRLDILALTKEGDELTALLARLDRILASKRELDKVIAKELEEAKEKLHTPRRTRILDSQLEVHQVDQRSLIVKEDVWVALTRDGYIKRTNSRSYQSVAQADGVDNPLPGIKVGDRLVLNRQLSTHDDILGFTSKGNYFVIPVWQIPEAKWREEGKHISTLVSLESSERIVSAFAVTSIPKGLTVVMLSRNGKLKRSVLDEVNLTKITTRPLRTMSLSGDDRVIAADITAGDSSIIVWSDDGYVNRFSEDEIPLVGLKAAGVKAMNLPASGKVKMAVLNVIPGAQETDLLVVSDQPKVTLISSELIPETGRLAAKTQAVTVPKSAHLKLIDAVPVVKTKGHYPPLNFALDKGSTAVDISGMRISAVGVLLRTENITLEPKGSRVVGVHSTGGVIDENTPVNVTPTIETKPVKASSDGSPKQPTFFDLLDDEMDWGDSGK